MVERGISLRVARPTPPQVAAITLLVLATIALRTLGLSTPTTTIWDESYYAFDAFSYLRGTPDLTVEPHPPKIPYERTWNHPPLGKALIAVGQGPLGLTSVGSRLLPAAFGVLAVLVVLAIATERSRSWWWGLGAATLLATDGLHVVQSRIAMLDVFASTFGLCALLLQSTDPPSRRRWHRDTATGLLFGAAVACKWSALPLAIVLACHLIVRARATGAPVRLTLQRSVIVLGVAPLAMYLACYAPFFVEHGADARSFAHLQVAMLEKQASVTGDHENASRALTWPFLLHPIRYYPEPGSEHVSDREVLALGNPALWTGFLGLLVIELVAHRGRFWRSAPLPIAGYIAMYGPWLFASRLTYSYYMLPAVPFMCLFAVESARGRGRAGVAGFRLLIGAAILSAAALAALWTGWPMPVWTRWFR